MAGAIGLDTSFNDYTSSIGASRRNWPQSLALAQQTAAEILRTIDSDPDQSE